MILRRRKRWLQMNALGPAAWLIKLPESVDCSRRLRETHLKERIWLSISYEPISSVPGWSHPLLMHPKHLITASAPTILKILHRSCSFCSNKYIPCPIMLPCFTIPKGLVAKSSINSNCNSINPGIEYSNKTSIHLPEQILQHWSCSHLLDPFNCSRGNTLCSVLNTNTAWDRSTHTGKTVTQMLPRSIKAYRY